MAGEWQTVSPDSMLSMRRNACVRIGGQIATDYSYRTSRATPNSAGSKTTVGDLSITTATLRINADMHPNVSALFRLDLADTDEPGYDDDILAEAMLVMRSVGGTGLELFAGKGRAPYGQDVTLGLLQSYAHAANRIDSSEGRVFVIDPPEDAREHGNPNGRVLAPMRPGQWDRTFQAGVAYQWDQRWRVEIALFQPQSEVYAARLRQGERGRSGSDLGLAGRVWWMPVEDVTVQFSALAAHSTDMADKNKRVDVRPDADMRANAYSFSAGFDWRRAHWRVFGEYQHALDWNFTNGYTVDTGQLGIAREFADVWRIGVVGETLRIRDSAGEKRVDEYYTLHFTVRYAFASGAFITGEYGPEWFRRTTAGRLTEKRNGHFFGVRLGFNF